METADFLTRQEPGELGARIPLYAPGRVGLDVAPGNRVVHDLPEHEQCRVCAAGCCCTVPLEPPDNTCPVDPVKRPGTENGHQLIVQSPVF